MATLCSASLNIVNSQSLTHARDAAACNTRMKTRSQIRHENLLALARIHGSMAALLRAMGRSDRDATYSQYKTGHRSIGDAAARNIEETLGLEFGAMDHEGTIGPKPVASSGIGQAATSAPVVGPSDLAVIGLGQDARAALTPRRRKIMESLMRLTDQQEAAVLAMVESMLPPAPAQPPKLSRSRATKERTS